MTKLAVTIVLSVLVAGIGDYLFVGGGSIKQKLLDGQHSLSAKIRSWDYVSN